MRRVEVKGLARSHGLQEATKSPLGRSTKGSRGYRLRYQYETGRTFHQHCEAI